MLHIAEERITDRSCRDDDLFSRVKHIRSTTRIWKRASRNIHTGGGLVRTENDIPCKRMLVHLQISRYQSLL